MKMKFILILAVAALVTACSLPEQTGISTSGDPEILALMQLLEGRYQGPDATVAKPEPADLMTDTRTILELPKLADHAMYWEVRSGSGQKVYRQIIMVLSRDGETIVQTSFRLREGLEWPAEINSASLATLSKMDFVASLPEGCESIWRKVDDGWAAYLDPDNCRVYSNRQQKWRKIEAETIVSEAGLRQTERGYSDTGEQLFGTPPDEYHMLGRL